MLPNSREIEPQQTRENVMRFAYVVLIALPFLSGCASRPVVQNQQSASVLPVYQAHASSCGELSWDGCR